MRQRLRSREILFEEDVRREQRNDNVHDIDLLLDATIRRAEEGLSKHFSYMINFSMAKISQQLSLLNIG